MAPPVTENSVRFMRKVSIQGECWIWTGSTSKAGYGVFDYRYGVNNCPSMYAHRASHLLFIGEIPDGKLVLHSCDNPPCVNPAHLRCGTYIDNEQDKRQRDRHARHETQGPNKLRWEQVAEIRRLYPSRTQRELAAEFGVVQSLIGRIVRNEIWKESERTEKFITELEQAGHAGDLTAMVGETAKPSPNGRRSIANKQRKCAGCGTEFVATFGKQVYCSMWCPNYKNKHG